jgi:hypothetical protein
MCTCKTSNVTAAFDGCERRVNDAPDVESPLT